MGTLLTEFLTYFSVFRLRLHNVVLYIYRHFAKFIDEICTAFYRFSRQWRKIVVVDLLVGCPHLVTIAIATTHCTCTTTRAYLRTPVPPQSTRLPAIVLNMDPSLLSVNRLFMGKCGGRVSQ